MPGTILEYCTLVQCASPYSRFSFCDDLIQLYIDSETYTNSSVKDTALGVSHSWRFLEIIRFQVNIL